MTTRPVPSALENRDIVVVALSDWDGPRRIRQYLTDELANRGNRVLFVEAGYSLTKFARTGNVDRLLRYRQGLRATRPNVWVLSLPPFIPGWEFNETVSRLNWWIARRWIRSMMKTLGFRNSLLWIYAYNGAPLLGTLDESQSVYLCNDAFAMLHPHHWMQESVRRIERELVAGVDIVISVSESLTAEKKPIAKATGTIHHGVDFATFEKSRLSDSVPPADIASLPYPRIGYSGVIRYMLDLDLVRQLAEQRPEWSFVFIGPVTESSPDFYAKVERLAQMRNVHFLGSKSPDDVPRYLEHMDVCILPYAQSELIAYYAVPLKFYEYLAAGKPVVWSIGRSELPSHVVRNGQTPDEFLSAIEGMLSPDIASRSVDRRNLARENSWARRVSEIDVMLSQLALSKP